MRRRPRGSTALALATFSHYTDAYDWFRRNQGRQEDGPIGGDTATFTLTVKGVASSIYGYNRLDVAAYCRAFTDACDELRARLGEN